MFPNHQLAAVLSLFFLISGITAPATASTNPRTKVSINSHWKFHKGQIPDYPENPAEVAWEDVSIPHTWNARDVMDDEPGYYRGVSWYKRSLSVPMADGDRKYFLHFEGANQETEVFVNGKSVGKHIGGYTAFTFDITDFLNPTDPLGSKSQNEILVKVDNSYNEDIPTLTADFTFFGGIYRDVYLISTSKTHFDLMNMGSRGVFISTPEVSAERAEVNVRSTLVNESDRSGRFEVVTTVRDKDLKVVKIQKDRKRLRAGEQVSVENNLRISTPELWSPDNPYLYQITTQILNNDGEVLDEVVNPLGLRWFRFDADEGFFLNGEPLKLIGTNRHQDLKDLGNAVPDELAKRDVELLKEMGGNFLRVAHYPHDPTVLETCDRLGILAAVEIPIINRITESEGFYENSKNMQVEMIRQNYNHPSVVIWAYMNEVLLRPRFQDDKERQEVYFENIAKLARELEDITRTEDPYRYTMIPNHGSFNLYKRVGLTDIPMIVGWNLYSGWYSPNIDRFAGFLDRHHQELPDKPVIITEFGADADPRLRSFEPLRFDMTVEYANYYHQVYLDAILERDFVAGATVWNLADFSSETRHDVVPHVNNKGLLGLDRVPKDTYYYYQAHLLDRPFLRIASRLWTHRSGVAKENSDYVEQPMEVFTNLEKAYLIINGEKLPEKQAENKVIRWDVPFVDGINTIEVVSTSGAETHKDYMEVDFRLLPYDLRASEKPFKDLSINLGTKGRVFIDDLTKQVWVPDQPYREGSFGHVGGDTYVMENNSRTGYGTDQNIKGTDLDPMYQTQLEGIEEYRVDTPNGLYDVILHFAEFETGEAAEILAYNLASEEEEQAQKAQGETSRVFSVSVNGNSVFTDLDIQKEYEPLRAINRKIRVHVTEGQGIQVHFDASEGEPILNGIEIKKVL